MLDKGVRTSAGTDATRVASYNPWVSLVLAGHRQAPSAACASRRSATASTARPRSGCWTEKVTWFSNEEGKEGPDRRRPARRPDRARSRFLRLPGGSRSRIITADLTVVGGKVVYGARRLRAALDESAPPPAMPDWSPVRTFKGYAAWGEPDGAGKNSLRRAAHDQLRLRPRLRRPWPRPCRRLVEQVSRFRRSPRLLGRARLRLLGGVSMRRAMTAMADLAARDGAACSGFALVRAPPALRRLYPGAGDQDPRFSTGAIAEMSHFRLSCRRHVFAVRRDRLRARRDRDDPDRPLALARRARRSPASRSMATLIALRFWEMPAGQGRDDGDQLASSSISA
jgi:hypothetical protein